jgi:phosphonate transport system substrate-binding protein
MKPILLCLLAAMLMACSVSILGQTPTAASNNPPTPTSITPPTARPTGEPGSDANPLLLALAPAAVPGEAVIAASEVLTGRLRNLTGFSIVAVQPPSEPDLLDALANHNAHIAVLSPFAYVLAHRDNAATVGLASQRDGHALYGAQLIANRESNFESFFDAASDQNTASAETALLQLRGKKPCWSDLASPSGHVIPLGFLNHAQAAPRPGAFLAGQPPVVRAVYAEGICDFGATFIDARLSPALEADYPDVLERVIVLWRIPAIIPYENLSFSTQLSLEQRRILVRAFMDLMIEPQGRSAMQTLYGIDALVPADESMYDEFERYSEASGIDLRRLLSESQH